MSLLEMVVASAIAIMLGLVVTRLFHSSMIWQARNLRRTNLQQQMMLALKRISGELQQSTPGGITVGSNQLVVQKIVDVSTDVPPRHIWDTALAVYFVHSGALYRRPWPPQPPDLGLTLSTSHPFHPDPGQLLSLCLTRGATLIGSDVSALQVSSPNTLPITVNVTVSEGGDSFSSQRTLSLRNAE